MIDLFQSDVEKGGMDKVLVSGREAKLSKRVR